MTLRTRAFGPALLAMASLAVSTVHARPKPSGFEAALPAAPPAAPRAADGSIFNVAGGYAPLHEGYRARALGDPVTIALIETTSTAKSVGSDSKRGGGIALTPPSEGPLSFLSAAGLKAANDSSFKGQGNASQTSTLSGEISVTIAEVRANGTVLLRGEKRMMLSQGDEWVRFSGIARLTDISPDNRIASTRIADARIEYAGKGALQRASRQGWLGRFFNMISPF